MDREAWRVRFMGSQRVGHVWATDLTFIQNARLQSTSHPPLLVPGTPKMFVSWWLAPYFILEALKQGETECHSEGHCPCLLLDLFLCGQNAMFRMLRGKDRGWRHYDILQSLDTTKDTFCILIGSCYPQQTLTIPSLCSCSRKTMRLLHDINGYSPLTLYQKQCLPSA